MAPSDSSRGGDASSAILCATLRSRPAPARSPVFSACRSPRAVPATPEESLGASAEHLPETCSLRPVNRGSASSILYGATSGFAARYGPWFRSRSSADARHAGPASTGCLAASRRGPRYPLAQRFVGVGSFHPTRHTLLHGAHSLELRLDAGPGARQPHPSPPPHRAGVRGGDSGSAPKALVTRVAPPPHRAGKRAAGAPAPARRAGRHPVRHPRRMLNSSEFADSQIRRSWHTGEQHNSQFRSQEEVADRNILHGSWEWMCLEIRSMTACARAA